MNILDFQSMKQTRKKISVVTCYDYWSAKIIAQSDINCALVGDSLAMVMHGHPTTIPATLEIMVLHTQAVARGLLKKPIITDMPFLAHRKGLKPAMHAVEKLIQAGAHAIKLEGAQNNLKIIKHIVNSGIPVMGHLGMTPQSIHQLGGYKVQGKNGAGETLLRDAAQLQEAGCFSIVLECIPTQLAQNITQQLTIPTIGIGAGPHVDGQVLVFQDLLGLNPDFNAKFLKQFLNGNQVIQTALNHFHTEVTQQIYPAQEHCY